MRKGTKSPKEENWLTYEAHLTDVYFEYVSPFKDEPKEEVEQSCRAYLDKFTNGYTMLEFYLKPKQKEVKA